MTKAATSNSGFAAARHRAASSALLIAAALLAHNAAAQALTGFPQAEPPRYIVELIVFTYADGAVTGNEIFVPESPPLDAFIAESGRRPGDAAPVFSDHREPGEPGEPGDPAEARERPFEPAGAAPEPALPDAAPPDAHAATAADEPREITGIAHNLRDLPLRARIELQLLAPEQYTMDEIYARLLELDAYQPIMRTAWSQTTPALAEAPAIRLRALADPPPGLDGTVTLYQGRFVHLGLDLELDAEGLYAGGGSASDRRAATDRAIARGEAADGGYGSPYDESRQPVPVYSDRGYGEDVYIDEGGYLPQPVRYRIAEVRIMRDGEIRYYDHPHFGVIARLTEVAKETPTAEP